MKYLVTGGAGFIGSHLCEKLLKNNHTVFCIDNLSHKSKSNILLLKKYKKFKFFKLSIDNFNKIEKLFLGIDIVFHLGALAEIVPSINFPLKYVNANVLGTANVMEACRKYKIKKIVYAASSSCYGIPDKFPTREIDKIDPKYPYALTKYLGEEIVMHWGKIYKLNVTSLRLFNVYGPRSRTSKTYGAVMGVFLAQKLNNLPLTIVGDGKQKRDFLYVDDVVDAFIKASSYKKSLQIFNVCGNKPIEINYLARLINHKSVNIPKRPGEPDQTFGDNKKIHKELKWKPIIKFKDGVNEVLKNISFWKKAPAWDKNKIKIATKDWFKYLV